MIYKNTALVGFQIGSFINSSDGSVVTTGTPTCKLLIDGVGGDCDNAASYNSDSKSWEIDLTADDLNGDMIGLHFELTDCLPINFSFKTVPKPDGLTYENILKNMYSAFIGKAVRTNNKTFQFLAQDGSTVLFTMSFENTGRTTS